MNDEDDLLNKIIRDPDSDRPRYDYANWLERLGKSERANFIRLDCVLYRMHVNDTYSPYTQFTQEYLQRYHLLKSLKEDWYDPVGKLRLPKVSLELNRGIAETIVTTVDSFLENADVISSLSYSKLLTNLELYGQIDRVEEMAAHPLFGQFRSVKFSDCLLPNRLIQDLTENPNVLSITQLLLGASDSSVSKQERAKDEHFIDADDAKILAISPKLSPLRHIDLSEQRIKDAGVKELAASNSLENIEIIDIGGNEIAQPNSLAKLAQSKLLKQTHTLGLQNNNLANRAIAELADKYSLDALRVLNLSRNQIGPSGIESLTNGKVFRILTSLYLRSNKITTEGARSIAKKMHLSGIQTLDLADNKIGNAGIGMIADALVTGQIKALNLAGNNITNKGIYRLAASMHNKLIYLSLNRNKFSDSGIAALVQSPVCARLDCLELWHNPIGEAGVAAIAKSPHLSNLKHIGLHIIAGTNIDALKSRFGSALSTLNY